MAAFRTIDGEHLSFSYGVNDCESALATLSIEYINTLLAHKAESDEDDDDSD